MTAVTVERGTGEDDGAVVVRMGDASATLDGIEACLLAAKLLDAAGISSRHELADEDFEDVHALIAAAKAGDEAGAKLILREASWRPLVLASAMTIGAAVDLCNAARLASFGADLTEDDLRAEWPGVLRKVVAIARGRASGLLEG